MLVEHHAAADQPGGQYTVKRLYTELVLNDDGERVRRARLQPENPDFSPIFVDDPDEFRVIAAVLDVLASPAQASRE